MTIYVAFAIVGALYAGVMAALIRHAPKTLSESSPLRGIDTSTKAGRRRFIETAARLAKEARKDVEGGID